MARYTIPKNNHGVWPVRGRIDPELRGPRAFDHPAVVRWHHWLLHEWRPDSQTILLTPCSNVKPYPRSPMSRKIRGVLRRLGLWDPRGRGIQGSPVGIGWLYLSDLLGLVPYERAHEYPACCYELPPNVVVDNPHLREKVVGLLSGGFQRMAEAGVTTVIVFLPSNHKKLFDSAMGSPRDKLSVIDVGYDIFYGHRKIEEVLRSMFRITSKPDDHGVGRRQHRSLDYWLH